jgi:tRNA (mo5U34)-methyltransferase
MSNSAELRQKLLDETIQYKQQMATGSWWHSIDLGNGVITPGIHSLAELQDNFHRFNLPESLSGKRVLDIGCWDGFYSFAAERRGARVTSVDCWRPENFFKAKAALQSSAEFHELSVYDVTKERLGAFDIVFFLGVLYHLRHPLLGLEQVCEVTRDFAIIESHVVDKLHATADPVMEFYEFDELGGQYDNWWGPNVECLSRMARSAGFARVELLRSEETRATLKAYRRWNDFPGRQSRHPCTSTIYSTPSSTTNAFRVKDATPRLALLVEGLPAHAQRWDVRVEIGGFGIHPNYVGQPGDPAKAGLTQINAPMPPGLELGKATVRVWHEGRRADDAEIEVVEGTPW